MRKQIKGILYDTETAKELAKWDHLELDGVKEVLYQTKSGKYFLYVVAYKEEGYERSVVPVPRTKAIWIACSAIGADEARPLFEPSDGEKRKMCVDVSSMTYLTLRVAAAERGISIGSLIDEMVGEGDYLEGTYQNFEEVARNYAEHNGDYEAGSGIYGWED